MAFKLVFSVPDNTMPFIWNVSQHVGPLHENPNRRTDVELVQFFLKELVESGHLGKTANAAVKQPPIRVNGVMDAVTGFWICFAQRGAQTADGVVSPAKGMMYSQVSAWSISKMNFVYRKQFGDKWQNLDNDQRLSSALRAELKKTTP